MSTKAVPIVPPRPSRSPNTVSSQMPKVPPRPNSRRVGRSVSPNHDGYAPSPLNELPAGSSTRNQHSSDASNTPARPPARPPSVALPSVGQEGMEYEGLDYQNASMENKEESHDPPVETRNVNRDLHLHAPKPSLPSSSAEAQVRAVTRTSPQQAAAAGFGNATSSPDLDDMDRPGSGNLMPSLSQQVSSFSSTNRRTSIQYGEEGGIPEIGQRVPMDPNAGDVQAPSPSPYCDEGHHHGVSSGGQQRAGNIHQRPKSSRENSLPPGSYGLHGHGVHPTGNFERAWYDKHPDELAREEQGLYGPGLGHERPEWALSGDDLNRIVKTSASTGLGLATHADVPGIPQEELAYLATDELTSRLASAPPESVLSKGLQEKEKVIHIDEPLHRQHHPDGFAPAPEDHKPHGAQSLEEPSWAEEGPNDAPVLAADEIEPGAEHLPPAISPTFEHGSPTLKGQSRSHSRTESRPSSQPSLTHGGVSSRVRFGSRSEEREEMHTELEDVREYEPLFPDDDEEAKITASTERFKRQPMPHRFPSKDIWEDAPECLQLEATVSTLDVPSEHVGNEEKSPLERPEHQTLQSRHGAAPSPISPSNEQSHLEDEKTSISECKQRFPSKDIWEDVPDSQRLVTTVQTPQEVTTATSPESPTKPATPTSPARLSKPIRPVEGSVTSPTETRKPPTIPNRPKPQVPVRPAKTLSHNSNENLTKTTSTSSVDTTAPTVVKAKPPIPSRPGGSKIAALKAGFLSQLEGQLKLGPQGPKPQGKKPEPEELVEKVPLSDARKGRARGPARRKPAVPAAVPAAEPVKMPAAPTVKIVDPWNVWQIGGDGILVVGNTPPAKAKSISPPDFPSAANLEPRLSESSKQASTVRGATVTYTDASPEATSTPITTEESADLAPAVVDSATTSSSVSRNPMPTSPTSCQDNGLEAPPPTLVEAEMEASDDRPLVTGPDKEVVEQSSEPTESLEKETSKTSDSVGTAL
ncbi:DUF3210 superfamily domain-containing protein [Histoplasma capsulatum G186AR]|uniref:DUF3210 superfamily domain-containing protein n=1 Tax=Ajellomyces capsulatus TaxID=5037 RepID=A0A8H7Y9T8_AJECA|nr:DUF3210 superfamily domain-containing protein [Histoplasma capsulatum]QSS70766.1 DUF3210 superfamily domain-containing protein [Histoplasma capsulatum G186AR]